MSAERPDPTSHDYIVWYRLGIGAHPGVGDFYEWIIQIIYASIVSPGDAVVDGGANRGRHTFSLSRIVGPDGLVVAFEAVPGLIDNLKEGLNAQDIENVILRSTAIGDSIGAVAFNHVTQADAYSGIKQRSGIPEYASVSSETITVPLTTIDADLASIPQMTVKSVRFVKLDLEGGEYDALRGAETILRRDRPLVVFENGREATAQLYGYEKSDLFSMFERLGYSVFDLFGRPFGQGDWAARNLPWYFIAAGREVDKRFVLEKLAHLIRPLADAITVGRSAVQGIQSGGGSTSTKLALPLVQASGQPLVFGILGSGMPGLQSGWHEAEIDGVWTNGPCGVVRVRIDMGLAGAAQLRIEGRVLGSQVPRGNVVTLQIDLEGGVTVQKALLVESDDFTVISINLPGERPAHWSGEATVTVQREISLKPVELDPRLRDGRDLGFFLKSIQLTPA